MMSLEQSPGKRSKILRVETTATEQMTPRKTRGKMKPRPLCFKPSRGRKTVIEECFERSYSVRESARGWTLTPSLSLDDRSKDPL